MEPSEPATWYVYCNHSPHAKKYKVTSSSLQGANASLKAHQKKHGINHSVQTTSVKPSWW